MRLCILVMVPLNFEEALQAKKEIGCSFLTLSARSSGFLALERRLDAGRPRFDLVFRKLMRFPMMALVVWGPCLSREVLQLSSQSEPWRKRFSLFHGLQTHFVTTCLVEVPPCCCLLLLWPDPADQSSLA